MRKTAFLLIVAVGFGLPFTATCQPTNPAGTNVRAWGDNQYGQCDVPPDLTNAVAIASSDYHNLVLTSDGTVRGWGNNQYGRCDAPPDATNVVAVAAGAWHSLILRADGTVRAWGRNSESQCDVPPDLNNVVAIAAGTFHSLARRADGSVRVWGAPGVNFEGQGVVPPDLTNTLAVSTAYFHNLAIRPDFSVRAWGSGWGYENGSVPPAPPADLTNIVAMAAGNVHSLALRINGTVRAWGGEGSSYDHGQFSVPLDLTNVVGIAAGGQHSLALLADGIVRAWGWSTVPSNLPPAAAVSAGYAHSLALLNSAGPPPTIFRHPQSRTVAIGASTRFSVYAVGPRPFTYQWYFGTNAIPGATNSFLVLDNLHAPQSGEYTVVVSNASGGNTSREAVLDVQPGLDLGLVPAIGLKGEVGWTYRLDYINAVGPTDAWSTLATLTLTNNPQIFLDYSAFGQPQRFYRMIKVP